MGIFGKDFLGSKYFQLALVTKAADSRRCVIKSDVLCVTGPLQFLHLDIYTLTSLHPELLHFVIFALRPFPLHMFCTLGAK